MQELISWLLIIAINCLVVFCDDCRFIYVEVGCNGRVSDGGVWRDCSFAKQLEQGQAGLPLPKPLSTDAEAVPHVLVGDEAFPLQKNLMKPYARFVLPLK